MGTIMKARRDPRLIQPSLLPKYRTGPDGEPLDAPAPRHSTSGPLAISDAAMAKVRMPSARILARRNGFDLFTHRRF
jgi:hypothetical protein